MVPTLAVALTTEYTKYAVTKMPAGMMMMAHSYNAFRRAVCTTRRHSSGTRVFVQRGFARANVGCTMLSAAPSDSVSQRLHGGGAK